VGEMAGGEAAAVELGKNHMHLDSAMDGAPSRRGLRRCRGAALDGAPGGAGGEEGREAAMDGAPGRRGRGGGPGMAARREVGGAGSGGASWGVGGIAVWVWSS
jgi:hypothetical protein